MKTVWRSAIPAILAFIVSSPLQAQGINGTWITEFERMMRNQEGNVSGGDKTKAKMVLKQKGDSVTGTWQLVDAPAGAPATPRQLRGTISGNKIALATEFDATVNINGEQSTRKISVTYDFTIDGDKLEGTMTNRSGDMNMPPRPFSAWRDKT
jgi:hypothetical protein